MYGDAERPRRCGEAYPEDWININIMINPETGEVHAIGGDREPCSHGHPPCCDTEYIGLELIKKWIGIQNT